MEDPQGGWTNNDGTWYCPEHNSTTCQKCFKKIPPNDQRQGIMMAVLAQKNAAAGWTGMEDPHGGWTKRAGTWVCPEHGSTTCSECLELIPPGEDRVVVVFAVDRQRMAPPTQSKSRRAAEFGETALDVAAGGPGEWLDAMGDTRAGKKVDKLGQRLEASPVGRAADKVDRAFDSWWVIGPVIILGIAFLILR